MKFLNKTEMWIRFPMIMIMGNFMKFLGSIKRLLTIVARQWRDHAPCMRPYGDSWKLHLYEKSRNTNNNSTCRVKIQSNVDTILSLMPRGIYICHNYMISHRWVYSQAPYIRVRRRLVKRGWILSTSIRFFPNEDVWRGNIEYGSHVWPSSWTVLQLEVSLSFSLI